jgi:hypothetical protein
VGGRNLEGMKEREAARHTRESYSIFRARVQDQAARLSSSCSTSKADWEVLDVWPTL